jgi:hypothetical protein
MAVTSKLLPRKRNNDGSYDSICLTCFATVGGCGPDGRLPEHDKAHVCDSAFFAERGLFTRTESDQHPASPPPRSQAA